MDMVLFTQFGTMVARRAARALAIALAVVVVGASVPTAAQAATSTTNSSSALALLSEIQTAYSSEWNVMTKLVLSDAEAAANLPQSATSNAQSDSFAARLLSKTEVSGLLNKMFSLGDPAASDKGVISDALEEARQFVSQKTSGVGASLGFLSPAAFSAKYVLPVRSWVTLHPGEVTTRTVGLLRATLRTVNDMLTSSILVAPSPDQTGPLQASFCPTMTIAHTTIPIPCSMAYLGVIGPKVDSYASAFHHDWILAIAGLIAVTAVLAASGVGLAVDVAAITTGVYSLGRNVYKVTEITQRVMLGLMAIVGILGMRNVGQSVDYLTSFFTVRITAGSPQSVRSLLYGTNGFLRERQLEGLERVTSMVVCYTRLSSGFRARWRHVAVTSTNRVGTRPHMI